jgi:small subunit ribosomal protein S8
MLTRIRNASLVRKAKAVMPFSKQNQAIAKILVKENYLEAVEIEKVKTSKGKKERKTLVLELKYSNKQAAIRKIIRVSKPGLRIYSSYKKLPRPLSGFGIAIVSTSKGLMAAQEARKKKLGGEILCKIW